MSEIIPKPIQREMFDHLEMCSGVGCVMCAVFGDMIDDLLAIHAEREKLKDGVPEGR